MGILCKIRVQQRQAAARDKNFALYQKLVSSCFSREGSLQSICTFAVMEKMTFFSIAVREKGGETEGKSPKFPLCA